MKNDIEARNYNGNAIRTIFVDENKTNKSDIMNKLSIDSKINATKSFRENHPVLKTSVLNEMSQDRKPFSVNNISRIEQKVTNFDFSPKLDITQQKEKERREILKSQSIIQNFESHFNENTASFIQDRTISEINSKEFSYLRSKSLGRKDRNKEEDDKAEGY